MHSFKKLTTLTLLTASITMLSVGQATAKETTKRKVVRSGSLIGDALPYYIYGSVSAVGVPITATLALGSVVAVSAVFVLRDDVARLIALSAASLGLTYLSAKVTWYCARKAHQIMENLTEEESED